MVTATEGRDKGIFFLRNEGLHQSRSLKPIVLCYSFFLQRICESHSIYSTLSESGCLDESVSQCEHNASEISHLVWLSYVTVGGTYPGRLMTGLSSYSCPITNVRLKPVYAFPFVSHCLLNHILTWSAFPFLGLWPRSSSSRWMKQSHSYVCIFLQISIYSYA